MMAWAQKTPVDLGAQDQAGMCLRFQQRAFPGSPVTYYPSARAAWDNAIQHAEMPPGDVITPISFSWIGNLGDGMKDWGHAAVHVPGRGVLSSPGNGYGQQWFDSIDACARYFGATYLGWTEDVGGFRVVDYVDTPAPTPAPTPDPSGAVHYIVQPGDTLWGIAVQFYNDGTRYPEIAAANGIENPNLIFPGQNFVIPGV